MTSDTLEQSTGQDEISSPRRRWGNVFLIVTALIPLLGLLGSPPQTMPLIYTVFVVAYFSRRALAGAIDPLPGTPFVKVIPLAIVSGWIVEILAWCNNWLEKAPEPVLFHPQLIPNLLLGIGVYFGWCLVWIAAFYFLGFHYRSAWLTMGFFGIFMENNGAVAITIAGIIGTAPHIAFFYALYVFAVYGSWLGLTLIAVKDPIERSSEQRMAKQHPLMRYLKYPIVLAALFLAGRIGAALFGAVWYGLGLIPEKRSIIEYPFF